MNDDTISLRLLFEKFYRPEKLVRYRKEAAQRYSRAVKVFAMFLERTPLVVDITPDVCKNFFAWALRQGHSASIVRQHRASLAALLKYAAERGIVDDTPELPSVVGKAGPKAHHRVHPVAGTLHHYYQTECRKTLSRRVREASDAAVKRYGFFIGGPALLEDITAVTIAEFRASMTDLKRSTACRYAGCLRAMVKKVYPDRDEFQTKPHNKRPRLPSGTIDGTIRKFFEEVYVPERLPGKANTAGTQQYRHMLDRLRDMLGREAMLSDLCDRFVSNLINHELAIGNSPATAKSKRNHITMIWRFACHKGLVSARPGFVHRIRANREPPTAWTPEEFDRIVSTCSQKSDMWLAWVLVVYDTGARFGSVYDLKKSDYNASTGYITFPGSIIKNGIGIARELSDQTREVLDRICVSDREMLFPWTCQKKKLHVPWRQILEASNLPTGRKEGFHKIRRTNATRIAAAAGVQAAADHLGHTDTAVTLRHYIDPGQMPNMSATRYLPRPNLPGANKNGGAA